MVNVYIFTTNHRDHEVVLIGDSGDFAHIRLDALAKYTVLGLLHWNGLI